MEGLWKISEGGISGLSVQEFSQKTPAEMVGEISREIHWGNSEDMIWEVCRDVICGIFEPKHGWFSKIIPRDFLKVILRWFKKKSCNNF